MVQKSLTAWFNYNFLKTSTISCNLLIYYYLFIFFVQQKNATKKNLNHDHMLNLNIDVKE